MLLLGAGISALFGVVVIQWITVRTKLGFDTAIAAVLSVFFGFGIVLLTGVQSVSVGQQAGLEDYILGSYQGCCYKMDCDRFGFNHVQRGRGGIPPPINSIHIRPCVK